MGVVKANPLSTRLRVSSRSLHPDHAASMALVQSRDTPRSLSKPDGYSTSRGQRHSGRSYGRQGGGDDDKIDPYLPGRGEFDFSQTDSHVEDEYLTMLLPSHALDWGDDSLAIQAALNGTAAVDGGRSTGAWVEIGCQIKSARLVQDVEFPES